MANYIVKRGDTLSSIAQRNGLDWRKLYEANKGIIGNNPNLIRVGTSLSLSGTPAAAPVAAPVDPLQARAASAVAPVSVSPFPQTMEELLGTDLQAAQESSTNEARAEWEPKRKSGINDLLQSYANRGLFRSGMRRDDQTKTNASYDRSQNTLMQQLLNSRRSELEDRYADIRRRWEDANREGKPVNIASLL